ncbi:MAG: hypothetical protein E7349_04450 [Clostridiales bacterium]|nr:hypothetical protein [Clostridiales bacterium]
MAKKQQKKKISKEKELKDTSTNVGIDYEKLAEIILLAQKINNSEKKAKEQPKGFWRKIWFIITNKKLENSNILTASIAGIMQLFFNFIALVVAILGVLCFIAFIVVLCTGENSRFLFNYIISVPLLLMSALITRGIANEIGREDDRNYIFTAFSGIVSFVALIISLIALFK